jgi:ZIP family zinc transporter
MPWITVLGFSIGVAVMLGMKWATERYDGGNHNVFQPSAMMLAMGVDVALDGILIGLAAAAGQKQGLLLTIGLVLEVLFLGVSCATSLVADGATRGRVLRAVGSLAALLLGGASAGALAVAALPAPLLDGMLAFGVAALLYLVTEELLVEAHEVGDTPMQTAMFFLGFIVLFTLDMFI